VNVINSKGENMKRVMQLALVLAAGFAVVACGRAGIDDVPETLGTLANVEGAVLGTTLEGDEIRLGAGSLEGKVVILNYWSTT
jgi:hypothetical protein